MRVLTDIRAHERRAAVIAFATLACVMAAHALLETARDALFLASLPASRLPWVYLSIAALGLAITSLGRARARAVGLSAWLLFSSAATVGFWLLVSRPGSWTLYALYVWSGLFATAVVVQFWVLLGGHYTVTEAKRVFGFVGSGAILGAIGGAALARVLAAAYPTRHLVLAASGVIAVAAVGPLLLRRALGEPLSELSSERPRIRDAFDRVRSHPYTRRVAYLVLASTLTFTLLDYVFKSVVARYVEPGELGSFFATLNVALNSAALVAQLILVRFLLRFLGLAHTLSILPLLLVLGAAGVAAGGGLVAALILKGADGSLRHSVHRTSSELLFVPMADRVRAGSKVVIDVVGQRGGQALASLGILAVVALAGPSVHALAVVTAVLAALWIGLAFSLRDHYLDLFRDTLQEQWVHTRADFPTLDLGSLESLIAGLNSPDDNEVIAAIDALEREGKPHLVPDLILYHPSSRVVLRAFELLAHSGRSTFLPLAERLLESGDPEVRAAALRAHMAVSGEAARLKEALAEESPVVQATALVGLMSSGGELDPDCRALLGDLLNGRDRSAQVALARAIRRQPSGPAAELLIPLAGAEDTAVRAEVARAMAANPQPRFVGALLSMLGKRLSRAPAREALVAVGKPALEALDRALEDPDLPPEVRHHVPRTISKFAPEEAAPILLSHIAGDHDEVVRYKVLRGLGRLRTENPGLSLEARPLERALRQGLRDVFRLIHWRSIVRRGEREAGSAATPVYDLLIDLLRDQERQSIERVFRLLNLLHPAEDFEGIHRGLESRDRRAQASSSELLSGLLEGRLARSLVAVVTEPGDARRLAASEPYYEVRELSYEGALAAMIEHGSETLESVAAYHAGELGLRHLAPAIPGGTITYAR